MLHKISFDEFLNRVRDAHSSRSFEWRYGQTIMNVLCDIWPNKYYELTATEYDCFYNDKMAQTTIDKLKKDWPSGVDIDDYINGLIKENENLKNIIESLKNEVKTQRKEIANLREERRVILNQDLPPNYNITLELK